MSADKPLNRSEEKELQRLRRKLPEKRKDGEFRRLAELVTREKRQKQIAARKPRKPMPWQPPADPPIPRAPGAGP